MQDQDLTAYLSTSTTLSSPSPLFQQATHEPERPLPFSCRSSYGYKCGLPFQTPIPTLYEDLPSDNHIRLLEILPGDNGPLQCKLHVGYLPDDQKKYEALSYTWTLGHDFTESQIECDGISIQVGSNLADGLRRLRKKSESRIIWADALCINQQDVTERNHQVSKMGSIFENAFQVVIWLGYEEPQGFNPQPPIRLRASYLAFSAVCSIVNDWRQTNGNIGIPEARHSIDTVSQADGVQFNILSAKSSLWSFVFKLYRSRWFSRLWVIQEIVLARAAIVVWDDCEISWDFLGLAAAIIRTNFDRISSSIRGRQENPYFQRMPVRRVPVGVTNAYFIYRLSRSQSHSTPLELSFLDILKLTRHFGCKDDRDRVFGLLGLPTTDRIKKEIIPDYNKSIAEVYQDLATKIIDSSSSLTLLSSMQRGRPVDLWQPGINIFDETIPSWVPQWNVLLTETLSPFLSNEKFAASGGKLFQRRVTDDPRVLVVRGLKVDQVRDIGKYDSLDYFYRGSDKANKKLRTSRVTKQMARARRTRADLERIALTLTAGQTWYGLPVEDIAAHVADYARCLLYQGLFWSLRDDAWGASSSRQSEIETRGNHHTDDNAREDHVTFETLEALAEGGNADRFLDAATTVCARRHRFVTARGMIGVGPEAMEPGDVICILYGADVPFVLRQDGDAYLLIGECFISELMHGDFVHQHPELKEECWIGIR